MALLDSSNTEFKVPNGGSVASVLINRTPSDSGSLHADSIKVFIKEDTSINSFTFSLDGNNKAQKKHYQRVRLIKST